MNVFHIDDEPLKRFRSLVRMEYLLEEQKREPDEINAWEEICHWLDGGARVAGKAPEPVASRKAPVVDEYAPANLDDDEPGFYTPVMDFVDAAERQREWADYLRKAAREATA